jgi:hypothetical protein
MRLAFDDRSNDALAILDHLFGIDNGEIGTRIVYGDSHS